MPIMAVNMNSIRIILNDTRSKNYLELKGILGEKTTSKAMDAAVEIVLALYKDSNDMTKNQINKWIPKKYIGKFTAIQEAEKHE